MNFNRQNRKFTDEQFYDCYSRGMNDTEIATLLAVSPSAVFERRTRLGLVSHYPKKLFTKTDVKQSYDNRLRISSVYALIRYKSHPEKFSAQRKAYRNRVRHTPEYRERRRLEKKRYRLKYPEKIRLQKKRYREKLKQNKLFKVE